MTHGVVRQRGGREWARGRCACGLRSRRGAVSWGPGERGGPRPRGEPRCDAASRTGGLCVPLPLHLLRPPVQLRATVRRVRRRPRAFGVARDDKRAHRGGAGPPRERRDHRGGDRRHGARAAPARDGRDLRAGAACLDHHGRAERGDRSQGGEPRPSERHGLSARLREGPGGMAVQRARSGAGRVRRRLWHLAREPR